MKHVYITIFDWSTEDSNGVEVEIFDTYEKAYSKFCEIIENEKNPELSWVGEQAFDENGVINKHYNLDEFTDATHKTDLWWNVVDDNNYYRHSFVDLQRKEIL